MSSDTLPVISIKGLTKRFLSTLALDQVDLTVARGEIHALVGENGAGKSTIIKILAGIHEPDAGEIRIDGKKVRPHSETVPISFVHQDLGLVDELSIGENVALVAGFPRSRGFISWDRVWSQAIEIYEHMGVEPPDPRALVGTLETASKTVLGIARALSRDARVLVLDEPTASLPEPDVQHLFEILRRLRAKGTSVIYVSHRLSELFELVDKVTVLRDGRQVCSRPIEEMTIEGIVHEMLGHDLDLQSNASIALEDGDILLDVSDLRVDNFPPLNFSVAAGEVLGLVGLQGAGQHAIGRTIFGIKRQKSGLIRLDGKEIGPDLSIAERVTLGLAFLAGDRLGESTISGMTLRENLFPNSSFLSGGAARPIRLVQESDRASDLLERFDVRPRETSALIEWLSGGNQQKVYVARWLVNGDVKMYIMEEPTAGIDIGAKELIHRILRGIAAQGASVLVISSDFEEVASLCDRALIVNRGAITSELAGTSLTLDALIARSSGGTERRTGGN